MPQIVLYAGPYFQDKDSERWVGCSKASSGNAASSPSYIIHTCEPGVVCIVVREISPPINTRSYSASIDVIVAMIAAVNLGHLPCDLLQLYTFKITRVIH